ncbi:MAG: prolipoprotein diacylglyceryl transferase [Polyangiaceae bacterium]
MIPYIHVKDIPIGPIPFIGTTIPLHPFGILVATGVLLGTALATWRARIRNVDLDKLNSFITWMLVAGFCGGHMLDTIFYHPTEIARIVDGHLQWTRPWSLFFLWEGLSSFGGFVGGFIGVILWKFFEVRTVKNLGIVEITWIYRRKKALPILPFCDIILAVFPVAWVFGRSGCSVVHDHPGARATADAILAVAYPDRAKEYTHFIEFVHGAAPRYDLGTLEMMFTVILAVAFAFTWWRKLPTGSYVVAVALAYSPVRFAMDYLRITEGESADPRYSGLTPAQWGCIALFAFGLILAFFVWRQRKRGYDPLDELLAPPDAEPHPPAEPAPVTT